MSDIIEQGISVMENNFFFCASHARARVEGRRSKIDIGIYRVIYRRRASCEQVQIKDAPRFFPCRPWNAKNRRRFGLGGK